MEQNDHTQAPVLCRKGCGFFGSPNFDGFCSKCHRDMQATVENVQNAVRLASVDPNLSENENTNSSQVLDCISDENVEESQVLPCIPEKSVGPLTNGIVAVDTASFTDSDVLKSNSSTSSLDELPKKKLRCLTCNKRVGLTGFHCRCGGLFCTAHRYSDSHKCAYDYRESGQDDIRKANPQVVCSKINKI